MELLARGGLTYLCQGANVLRGRHTSRGLRNDRRNSLPVPDSTKRSWSGMM
jgi:hypothetical protein